MLALWPAELTARDRSSTPTRTRTRNSSLEARHDPPFHHRGTRAEGKGFEPSSPSRGNRLSRTARPTVSGYLPFEWTHRESNPDLRPRQGRCRPAWTMSPSISDSARVDRRGVEPRSPGVQAGVVPLDQQPISSRIADARGPPGNRTRSTSLPRRRAAGTPADRSADESSRQDSNLRYPVCKTGVLAARRRDELRSVARVGVEPTGTRLSTWPRCQFAYPCHRTPSSCGSGSRTSASERMKLGRAPAHPRVPGPGIEPGTPAL